jgi:hypothetical protein
LSGIGKPGNADVPLGGTRRAGAALKEKEFDR